MREKRKCIRLFVAIVEFLTLILLKCFACKKFTMYDLNDIMRVSFYLLWIQQPLARLKYIQKSLDSTLTMIIL